MSIEEDVFRKRKVKEDALISYGFKKKNPIIYIQKSL